MLGITCNCIAMTTVAMTTSCSLVTLPLLCAVSFVNVKGISQVVTMCSSYDFLLDYAAISIGCIMGLASQFYLSVCFVTLMSPCKSVCQFSV